MTTRTPRDPAFDEIVDTWDEPPRCQTGQSPRPCQRPATWLAIQHAPCGHKLLCTYHRNRWIRRRLADMEEGWAPTCATCHQYFQTIDGFARFVRL
ncbi:hypothetical protein [Mycobacterium sp. E3305]|uniref:hypothetical protein n=1 Tax=Mycobacterium sp. E3305 TaxID=1834145 RepID=UPI00082F6671|nr:hypothetical protein [Mycobacterium sp. E3305]